MNVSGTDYGYSERIGMSRNPDYDQFNPMLHTPQKETIERSNSTEKLKDSDRKGKSGCSGLFCRNSSVKPQPAQKFNESRDDDFESSPVYIESIGSINGNRINSIDEQPSKSSTEYPLRDNRVQLNHHNQSDEQECQSENLYSYSSSRRGETPRTHPPSEHQQYQQYRPQQQIQHDHTGLHQNGPGQQQYGSEQPQHIIVHGPGQQLHGPGQQQHGPGQQLHGPGQQLHGEELREVHHYYDIPQDMPQSEPSLFVIHKKQGPNYPNGSTQSMNSHSRDVIPINYPSIPSPNMGKRTPSHMCNRADAGNCGTKYNPPVGTREQMMPDQRHSWTEWNSKSPERTRLNQSSPQLNVVHHEGSFRGSSGDMIHYKPIQREYNARNEMNNSSSAFKPVANSISASSLSYSVDDGHMYSISQPKWRTSSTGQPIERGSKSKFKAGDILRRTSFCPHIMCDFGGSLGLVRDGDTMCIDYVTDDLIYFVGGVYPLPDLTGTGGLFVKVGERQS